MSIEVFDWTWHHFRPLGRANNYIPILQVLANHDGEEIKTARASVNKEVDQLNLGVGLGKRQGEPFANIFRDRIDVWRFTGAIVEPGLVQDEIRLTELGHALLDGSADFVVAMQRQALRLGFPRIRCGRTSHLDRALDDLHEGLKLGPGVNVARAWAIASGHLRELGVRAGVSGEEAARFLSGAVSLADIPARAAAIARHRRGVPSGFPEVQGDRERQGREIEFWLRENGALMGKEHPILALDPEDREFAFAAGTYQEMTRWSKWWGSWPDALKEQQP